MKDAEHRLDWWLRVFQCRFIPQPNNLPREGSMLLGYRFRLQYEDRDGQWKTWKERRDR